MHRKNTGLLAVIISGIVFGCAPLLAKMVYKNGGNSVNLVFWKFFISILPLYLIVKRSENISLKLTKREMKQITIVGIVGYSGVAVLLYSSYNYISTGMATTLHFIYPVLVIIASIVFFKEKISKAKIISVILCSLGILLLYESGTSGDTNYIRGILLAFGSGVVYAFYVLYIDRSGLKLMNPFKLTLYMSIVGSVVMLVFSIAIGEFTMNISPKGWIFTIIFSLVVSLGAVSLLNVGIKLIGAQSASILSTLEPITSVIIGVFVFGEELGIRGVLACLFIVVAVVVIAAFDKEDKKKIDYKKDKENKQIEENILYNKSIREV